MAQFDNCEVNFDKNKSQVAYREHNFQVQQVKARKPGYTGAADASLMFCTNCGASYLLADDGEWHRIETGKPLRELVAQKP